MKWTVTLATEVSGGQPWAIGRGETLQSAIDHCRQKCELHLDSQWNAANARLLEIAKLRDEITWR